jgi:hypothetical protein
MSSLIRHSFIVFLVFLVFLVSLVFLSACDRLPESYPPPEQRQPVPGINDLGPEAMLVSMGSPEADRYIVKDVYPGTGISWRWTKKEPTVRVPLRSPRTFSADFALWQDSFRITGPLTISFLVNGKLLDKIRYTTPGEKRFEKAVPPEWFTGGDEAIVALSVDKLYTEPRGGSKFGVILVSLGLKP